MTDAADAIYTAATDDLDRLIAELGVAKDNLDWAEMRAKAEAITVLAPLIELASGYIGGEE